MKILYCASECVPFVKTGGLADVAGSLPGALKKQGQDVRVILPKYSCIDDYWKTRMEHLCSFSVLFGWEQAFVGVERVVDGDVTYYFIDHESYFGRDYVYGEGPDEGVRFAYFCRAVLEAMPRIDFFPDVLHLNDWQTGLAAAMLKTQYQMDPRYSRIKTVFSIHNLRYQGVFDFAQLNGRLGFDQRYFTSDYLEFFGNLNCMKAGLVFCDHVCTVSPTYASEITTPFYGENLEGLLRARGASLSGILNGIDTLVYDPATDRFLENHFSLENMEPKAACKALLQKECGLEQRPDVPVIGVIARLSAQKGFDLIERVLPDILRQDVQLIVLGAGERRYFDLFNWAEWRYPKRVAFRTGMNEPLAHRIYGGADMFLMPSLFEPCGLSQMISQHYGTVPIVRETGGLKDTVIPYNQYTGEGDGFSFANYNAHEMLFCVERAATLYRDNPEAWRWLMRHAMEKDYSWTASAQKYIGLYGALLPKRGKAAEGTPAKG